MTSSWLLLFLYFNHLARYNNENNYYVHLGDSRVSTPRQPVTVSDVLICLITLTARVLARRLTNHWSQRALYNSFGIVRTPRCRGLAESDLVGAGSQRVSFWGCLPSIDVKKCRRIITSKSVKFTPTKYLHSKWSFNPIPKYKYSRIWTSKTVYDW